MNPFGWMNIPLDSPTLFSTLYALFLTDTQRPSSTPPDGHLKIDEGEGYLYDFLC